MMLPDNIVFTKDLKQAFADFFSSRNYSSIIVLVDENTEKFCYPLIMNLIPDHFKIMIQSGEQFKNLDTCQNIWKSMTENNLDRKSLMINLGGGVIGDMGGFCAATYKRGIDFVNVPTTLLAQVDASIGGKLGIDFENFKNHIGVFKDPELVIINPDFLKTLEQRELRSGFAEVVKHCLIADEAYWHKISAIDFESQNWEQHILHSIEVKYKVVEDDPFEAGLRKILNFGHTIGHAIESYFLNGSSRLLHGEAIVIGMICEAFISTQKCSLSTFERDNIANYLVNQFGHSFIEEQFLQPIANLVMQDKKNEKGLIKAALLQDVGKAVIDVPISKQEVTEAIRYYNGLKKLYKQ